MCSGPPVHANNPGVLQSNRGSFSHNRSPYWRDTENKARKMPGLGGFSIAVNSFFLGGKRPILGGSDRCTHLGFLGGFLEKFFNQDSLKNFQSKSAWKFSIKLRLIRINFSIAILFAEMRIQLHLSGKELDDLIRCPLSGEDYAKLLIERGVFKK